MALPSITREGVINAISYIDANGIPDKNNSTKYNLVWEDGKKYPVKYVVAVANHLENGIEILTDGYNSIEANSVLKKLDFVIEENQEKFELIITAEQITSTDGRFDIGNLSLGDGYRPLEAYFKRSNGDIVRRNYNKGEKNISNQTLPRIAFQVFEKQIASLSVEEKEGFPICRYTPDGVLICGIYTSVENYKAYRNTIEYMTYEYDNGRQFVIYCWNIFSTVFFVQECLKRFGETGDCFVLKYREKDEKEIEAPPKELIEFNGYRNPYSQILIESKNVIFRGAPGTGKSYLAKEIATDIVSDGYYESYTSLSDEQKQQIEFVQFHPGYDYTDFVEGLRPKLNADGSMGFELRDGIFKRFIDRARKNWEDSQKSEEVIEKEASVQETITEFLSGVKLGVDRFKTVTGNEFVITDVDESYIQISIPNNPTIKELKLSVDEIRRMLESGERFDKIKDVTAFFGKVFATQAFSYDFALYKAIASEMKKPKKISIKKEKPKKFVFIIDEINRGEISKILGELFFAIDPSYRGKAGEISTQYSSLHTNPDEKLYIPENVYIIGTMNDIDRSVDTFDFAMRRRFRFIEIKADEKLEMLNDLNDEDKKNEAIRRLTSLNDEIVKVDGLNSNYQIGAAYFLKLKTLTFEQLWTDYLQPLLQEYINGMYDEEGIMYRLEKAYNHPSEAYDEDGQG